MLGFILLLLLGGLIIGALARLLVPGPNPMGIGATILLGVAGSFIGGLIGRAIFGSRSGGSFLLAVLAAVVLLLIFQGGRRRSL